MAGLEPGMVCVKTTGREAGKRVVVIEFDKKKGLAVIDGPLVKKRKCNAKHLLPTGKKISLSDAKKGDFSELAKKRGL